ncbi:MAG TPA: hypothetical protein VL332_03590 [Candidatus Saccharimonadaceae bacterium]|jgi:hypothetical protein|nr:hypothetical protein [Candidatus Saccharimonadaceae bacterium]
MSARTVVILRRALLAWGGLTLATVVAVILVAAYSNGRIRTDASKRDVRFVLNWCELGDDRIVEVVHSYATPRAFTGDHLEAYAIRISHVDVSELTVTPDSTRRRWFRGDQLPSIVRDALDTMRSDVGHDPIAWFPTVDELGSASVYVYPWSIVTHGVTPSEVDLIFVRPRDKMVFYYGSKV